MENAGRAGPSRAWFILPVILLLAAALLVGLGFSSFLHFLSSDLRAYQPGSSISVTGDGFTLYAPYEAREAIINLRCSVKSPDREVPLSPSTSGGTLSNEQGRFVTLASTPAGMPAGRYAISCVDETSAGVNVALYLGPRVDLAAVGRGIAFSIIVPIFLGFCSVTLFVILAVLRYRSGQKARSNA